MTRLLLPLSVSDTVKSVNALLGWHQHPRNGKIARLPEPMRTWINQMLDDGLPYRAIIRSLETCPTPPPYPITEVNLSNWYHGGYQDWCHQRLLREARSAAAN